MSKKSIVFIAILFLAVSCRPQTTEVFNSNQPNTVPSSTTIKEQSPSATTTSPVQEKFKFDNPIFGDKIRVTKKPFGIKISPNDSPVSPERFSGFHTGVDFETTPEEQDQEVVVNAVCDGKILMKKWATGYGGVAVQSCRLNNLDVTVVYGHLLLNSITTKVGSQISSGDKLGILGKGFSDETDGERKHLHLAMHKGTQINILGYVKTSVELKDWLDPLDYLP